MVQEEDKGYKGAGLEVAVLLISCSPCRTQYNFPSPHGPVPTNHWSRQTCPSTGGLPPGKGINVALLRGNLWAFPLQDTMNIPAAQLQCWGEGWGRLGALVFLATIQI